jgi:hypothetical protein
VRVFVGELVRGERYAEDALLLASELATNAVCYGAGDFVVSVQLGDVLRIEVRDDSPVSPQLRQAAPGDIGGRGLQIVDTLALDWGTEPHGPGKVVWFTLGR